MKATAEQIRHLVALRHTVTLEREIEHGVQIRVDTGAVVNVYNNGTVLVQGPQEAADTMRTYLEAEIGSAP